MKYPVPCTCGHELLVELFQASSRQVCPECRGFIQVPDSITLQQQAGESRPGMTPLERLQSRAEEGKTPFDGNCFACSQPAVWWVPLTLKVLKERISPDVQHLPYVGLKLLVSQIQTEENWRVTRVPLNFCQRCHARFQAQQFWSSLLQGGLVVIAVLSFLGIGYGLLAGSGGWLFAAFVSLAVSLRIYFKCFSKNSQLIAPFLRRWLSRSPYFGEVLEHEGEYTVWVDEARRR